MIDFNFQIPHTSLCAAASGSCSSRDSSVTTLIMAPSGSPSLFSEETLLKIGGLSFLGEVLTVVNLAQHAITGVPIAPVDAWVAILSAPGAFLFPMQIWSYIQGRKGDPPDS